jgi:replicative DNA helicase
MTGRIPPHNLEAEASVLGSLLLDHGAVVRVADLLQQPDFYLDQHGLVYRAVLGLYQRSEPIDLVTLSAELDRTGDLDRIGGQSFLAELEGGVPTTANVEFYARLIRDAALKRGLITKGGQITALGFDDSATAEQALDKAQAAVLALADRTLREDFTPVKDSLSAVWESAVKAAEKGLTPGVPSGFRDLDARTGGFQRSNLILVAGRPGMGKTSFVLNVAQHVAQGGTPVGIFSLEMSESELAARLLCAEAGVDAFRFRMGQVKSYEWEKVTAALGRLSSMPLYLDDSPALTISDVRTKARRLKASVGLGMVVVDYLQLMQAPGRENRVQEVSEISRSLKTLARELRIPVLACSQLNRKAEDRPDKRPQLSDLRESGAQEQDADLVLFLHRPALYEENPAPARMRLAKLIIAKHRNGPPGEIELVFLGELTRFADVERIQREVAA